MKFPLIDDKGRLIGVMGLEDGDALRFAADDPYTDLKKGAVVTFKEAVGAFLSIHESDVASYHPNKFFLNAISRSVGGAALTPREEAPAEGAGEDLRSCAHDAAVALESVLSAPEDETRRPHARHYLDRLNAALRARTSEPTNKIDPIIRAAMYRSHIPLHEDRLIKSAQALVTACHRADEREELDEEIDGSMLDDIEEAIAELVAARARTSEPEAGEAVSPFMWAYESVTDGEWKAFPRQLQRADGSICPGRALYTHPSPATADKLREILKGIDQQETTSDDGWWETSVGAAFGAKKLAEVLAILAPEADGAEPDETERLRKIVKRLADIPVSASAKDSAAVARISAGEVRAARAAYAGIPYEGA